MVYGSALDHAFGLMSFLSFLVLIDWTRNI